MITGLALTEVAEIGEWMKIYDCISLDMENAKCHSPSFVAGYRIYTLQGMPSNSYLDVFYAFTSYIIKLVFIPVGYGQLQSYDFFIYYVEYAFLLSKSTHPNIVSKSEGNIE